MRDNICIVNEEANMKWFECWGEMVEVVYQLIEAKNAQDAERQFRAMYSGVLNVRIKENLKQQES